MKTLDNATKIRLINISDFKQKQTIKEKIEFLLNFAILAPSTHNSQPWSFIIKDNTLKIVYDNSINIKIADPDNRYKVMSLGCCFVNVIIAAAYYNFLESYSYNEQNDKIELVIVFGKVTNIPAFYSNELFFQILKRKNSRGVFKSEKFNRFQLNNIKSVNIFKNIKIDIIDDNKKINSIASLTKKVLKELYSEKEFRLEWAKWIKTPFSKNMKGISSLELKPSVVLSPIIPIVMRYFNVSKKASNLVGTMIKSSAIAIVLSSNDLNKLSFIEGGMLAELLMLKIQSMGFQTSIAVAALSNPESKAKLMNELGINEEPIFIFFAGKMEESKYLSTRVEYNHILN